MLVDEGDVVKEGQLLAILNRTETAAMVQRAEIDYNSSLRDLTRVQNLFADSAATRQQLDDMQSLVDVRKAELVAARFALERSVITAPADGIILHKMAEENSQVSQGDPILILGTRGIVVIAGVSDRDIHRLSNGDPASFTSTAFPGEVFEGRISRIPSQAVARTGIFEVEVSLRASSDKLRSGLIVRGSMLPSVTQPLIAVPVGALVEADGNEVWVYTTVPFSDKANRIKVRPVHLDDDIFYVQPQDLSSAHRVITRGAAYLRPDSRILVTNEVQR
jgi:RND family efflux transporter MFP subunit